MLRVKRYKKKTQTTPEVIITTSDGIKYRMTEDKDNSLRIMRVDTLSGGIKVIPEVSNVIRLIN